MEGFKGGVADGAMCVINRQPPGKIGRRAKEFLVEVIAVVDTPMRL